MGLRSNSYPHKFQLRDWVKVRVEYTTPLQRCQGDISNRVYYKRRVSMALQRVFLIAYGFVKYVCEENEKRLSSDSLRAFDAALDEYYTALTRPIQ